MTAVISKVLRKGSIVAIAVCLYGLGTESLSYAANKADQQKNTTGSKPAASTTAKPGDGFVAHPGKAKPKVLPWTAFAAKSETENDDEERTYNIFKYKMNPPKVDSGNPENWRAFNPAVCAEKIRLVPSPVDLSGLGPDKYSNTQMTLPQDPSKKGASNNSGNKIVFAHQGTPLANGWLAPQAGYAYQIDGTVVYGTTNYTPINYNGEINKYLGLSRVPVDILSSSGTKQNLDLSRVVFAINDDLLTGAHNKVYPSIIYLKPGEKAAIQGYGTVDCPRPGSPEQVIVQTLSGDQIIKVICTPENPLIPGKITP